MSSLIERSVTQSSGPKKLDSDLGAFRCYAAILSVDSVYTVSGAESGEEGSEIG